MKTNHQKKIAGASASPYLFNYNGDCERAITFPLRTCATVALVVSIALITSCATQQQVEEIVNDSNAELLQSTAAANKQLLLKSREISARVAAVVVAAGAPVADDNPTTEDPGDFEEVTARISDFIDDHPDMPEVINPLRVRLGVLYLKTKQPNQAEAVMREVQDGPWLNERDRVILILYESLGWWYRLDPVRFAESDTEHADAALDQIKNLVAEPERSPEIRAWLEQLRVRIALTRVRNTRTDLTDDEERETAQEKVRSILSQTFEGYGGQFDKLMVADLRRIESWSSGNPGGEDDQLNHPNLFRWYANVNRYFAEGIDLWVNKGLPAEEFGLPEWMSCEAPGATEAHTKWTCEAR